MVKFMLYAKSHTLLIIKDDELKIAQLAFCRAAQALR
jgi:hypothetical protein